jgi:hypothetical protein
MPSLTETLAERMTSRESAHSSTDATTEADAHQIDEPQPDQEPTEQDLEAGETSETEETGEFEDVPEDITTLKDFAKAAGWEPDDIYGLKLTLETTGEEVALGEMKDRLTKYGRERDDVAAQKQQLDQYAQQLQAQAQEYFSQRQAEGAEANAARESMMAIEARYNSVDWDGLAKADPGRAALLQQQLAVEYAGAKQAHAQAAEKEAQAAYQLTQQTRMQHAQALLNAVPEWRDQTRLNEELGKLRTYLGQWFQPQELETIYDWRAMTLARKAYLYDQGQVAMKDIEQKVKSAPKPVMKPGGGVARGAAATAKEAALVAKARQTGHRDDQVAAASMILQRAFGENTRTRR